MTYTKCDKHVCNVDTVKKHLAVERLAAQSNQEEEPITSGIVERNALKEYHSRILGLLRKQ